MAALTFGSQPESSLVRKCAAVKHGAAGTLRGKSILAFDIEDIHLDGPHPRSWHEALLRVVAKFSVRRGHEAVWTEVDVPILELAHQMLRWLSIDAPRSRKFVYQSMESDIPEWLWFRPLQGGWTVGCGSSPVAGGLGLDELTLATQLFLDDVRVHVASVVGVDADDVIRRPS
jgi:hypothetical protein